MTGYSFKNVSDANETEIEGRRKRSLSLEEKIRCINNEV